MHRSPPPTEQSILDVRAIIRASVSPNTAITSIKTGPHPYPQQVYEVKLTDSTTMLVVMQPPALLRLLRSEQTMIKSEAVVVRWLREEVTRRSMPGEGEGSGGTNTASHPIDVDSDSSLEMPFAAIPAARRHNSNVTRRASGSTSSGLELLAYIPTPFPPSLSLSESPKELPFILSSSSTFNVFTPPPGSPIATLSMPLSPEERMAVDYQAGKLIRQLSRLAPTSRKFGPALAVLAPQPDLDIGRGDSTGAAMGSWSVAFHSILESILRDGEDVAVALAYPTVRKHFRRFCRVLDAVSTPCLVVVDAMDDTNLLVKRHDTEDTHRETRAIASSTPIETEADTAAASTLTGSKATNGSDKNHQTRLEPESHKIGLSKLMGQDPSDVNIVVTGLRDWSHCIFGDPLFASVFCEHPTTSFLDGFNDTDVKSDQIDDDKDNRAIRLLLYQCYHAVVQIVRGFYRPGKDQTTNELAARKRLTEILAKLEAIEDDPEKILHHRRPSGEMSPAKRPRSESGDDGFRRCLTPHQDTEHCAGVLGK